jgi:hypothetical protein
MRVHAILTLAIMFHCNVGNAQWSSFKPITKQVLPPDQKEIDGQTVEDGKVVDKVIRVDWYGFTLEGETNVVKDRYQYPVADPTLAAEDKIVAVMGKSTTTAADVWSALRQTKENATISITIIRRQDGSDVEKRIRLYRANSAVLNALFNEEGYASPPYLTPGVVNAWGSVGSMSLKAIAIADDGTPVFSGEIHSLPVENVILTGWTIPKLNAGDKFKPPTISRDSGNKNPKAAGELAIYTGSCATPKEKIEGGSAFLHFPSSVIRRIQIPSPKPRAPRQSLFIIGIGTKSVVKVDGKELKVNVVVNME